MDEAVEIVVHEIDGLAKKHQREYEDIQKMTHGYDYAYENYLAVEDLYHEMIKLAYSKHSTAKTDTLYTPPLQIQAESVKPIDVLQTKPQPTKINYGKQAMKIGSKLRKMF